MVCNAGARPANRLGDMMLEQIGERWGGWRAAGGRVAKSLERPEEWQSAGLITGLCSEKCGCVGEVCPTSASVGAGRASSDGAADSESCLPPANLPAEPVLTHADAGMSTVEYATV